MTSVFNFGSSLRKRRGSIVNHLWSLFLGAPTCVLCLSLAELARMPDGWPFGMTQLLLFFIKEVCGECLVFLCWCLCQGDYICDIWIGSVLSRNVSCLEICGEKNCHIFVYFYSKRNLLGKFPFTWWWKIPMADYQLIMIYES